jgi:hypothetical protein
MVTKDSASSEAASAGIIFVVGNSRSGTTMMASILGRHPEVLQFRELHFFERLWLPGDEARVMSEEEAAGLAARLMTIERDGFWSRKDPGRLYNEAGKVIETIPEGTRTPADVFEAFLSYEAKKNGKRIPCTQTPRNVFYIGEILKFYPGARVINMVRDPRDVLLSQKNKWRRRFLGQKNLPVIETVRTWMNYHPITISRLWNASVRCADAYKGNGRVFTLRFEDLLEKEDSIPRLCEFLGIPFSKEMLEIPRIGSSNVEDRPDRKGLNPARKGAWTRGGLNPTEIYLCQNHNGELMERHGYPAAPVRPNVLRLFYYCLTAPVKLSLALLLNLKRMKNIREAIRRRLR